MHIYLSLKLKQEINRKYVHSVQVPKMEMCLHVSVPIKHETLTQ